MSVYRLWHWPNIEPTMGECPCLPGYAKLPVLGGWQWSLINCNALKTIGQIVSNCATFHIVAACLVAGCEPFIGIINCQSVCLPDWLIAWLTIALSSSSQLSTLNAAVFNRHREGNLTACSLKSPPIYTIKVSAVWVLYVPLKQVQSECHKWVAHTALRLHSFQRHMRHRHSWEAKFHDLQTICQIQHPQQIWV